jgi:hypothetical protein
MRLLVPISSLNEISKINGLFYPLLSDAFSFEMEFIEQWQDGRRRKGGEFFYTLLPPPVSGTSLNEGGK